MQNETETKSSPIQTNTQPDSNALEQPSTEQSPTQLQSGEDISKQQPSNEKEVSAVLSTILPQSIPSQQTPPPDPNLAPSNPSNPSFSIVNPPPMQNYEAADWASTTSATTTTSAPVTTTANSPTKKSRKKGAAANASSSEGSQVTPLIAEQKEKKMCPMPNCKNEVRRGRYCNSCQKRKESLSRSLAQQGILLPSAKARKLKKIKPAPATLFPTNSTSTMSNVATAANLLLGSQQDSLAVPMNAPNASSFLIPPTNPYYMTGSQPSQIPPSSMINTGRQPIQYANLPSSFSPYMNPTITQPQISNYANLNAMLKQQQIPSNLLVVNSPTNPPSIISPSSSFGNMSNEIPSMSIHSLLSPTTGKLQSSTTNALPPGATGIPTQAFVDPQYAFVNALLSGTGGSSGSSKSDAASLNNFMRQFSAFSPPSPTPIPTQKPEAPSKTSRKREHSSKSKSKKSSTSSSHSTTSKTISPTTSQNPQPPPHPTETGSQTTIGPPSPQTEGPDKMRRLDNLIVQVAGSEEEAVQLLKSYLHSDTGKARLQRTPPPTTM